MHSSCREQCYQCSTSLRGYFKGDFPSYFCGIQCLDGFELYTRLHTMKELRNVPTLMLGTQVPPIETDHCEVKCIENPFDSDMLITAIEALTHPPSEYFVHSFN